MPNLKRFTELCLQFLLLFDFDIFAVQQNYITGSIVFRLDAFIVGLFLKFLDMVKVFFKI